MSVPALPSVTPQQLQSLRDFATQVDSSSLARNGFTFASADTDRLRTLADCVSTHIVSGAGVFAPLDLELLTGAGAPLLDRAARILALPGIVEAERLSARNMKRLGHDILAVREYVRAHLPGVAK